jgi:hypothetical protein
MRPGSSENRCDVFRAHIAYQWLLEASLRSATRCGIAHVLTGFFVRCQEPGLAWNLKCMTRDGKALDPGCCFSDRFCSTSASPGPLSWIQDSQVEQRI